MALGEDDGMLLSGWLVDEGQRFAEGDPLFEVETDKATMEVEAPAAGVLARRLHGPGTRLAPGEPVALLAEIGEGYAENSEKDSEKSSAVDSARDGAAAPPAPEPVDPPAVPDPSPVPAAEQTAVDGQVDGEASLELSTQVIPVTAAGALYGFPARRRPESNSAPASVPTPREPVRVPLSRHRRALARLMTASTAIPQFSVHRELPMAEAVRLVGRLRRAGVAATITDVLLRATAVTLARHTEWNGWLVDDAVQRFATPAISLATDSPAGVVAPVVRGAERLGWAALAAERARVVGGARRGRLLPADMTGGTFSISNVGALGGDLVVPLLTPPQLGILGVGRIRPAWGTRHATAALVADHRALDGADAARFLATLADVLADADLLDDTEVLARG